MSNLSSSPTPVAITPHHRARKRRAKRGIVANYIHEISPRHRAAPVPVPVTAPVASVAPAPAAAPAAIAAAEPLAG